MFGKTPEGSTGRLIQLCAGYFLFYVATGLIVKVFTGGVSGAPARMNDIAFLAYNTLGVSDNAKNPIFTLPKTALPATEMINAGPQLLQKPRSFSASFFCRAPFE